MPEAGTEADRRRPRLLFLAFGFPPAAKSSTYRLRTTANQFAALGWDVTVVNAPPACWANDFGLDESLLDHVDPRIRLVEIPVSRPDLETDIRRFSEERAREPGKWARRLRARNRALFPESTFGGWRPAIEQAVLELHDQEPFDLVLASCVPYTAIAGALKLFDEREVPFALDFRDGWSIDVVGGEVAFGPDTEEGQWEAAAVAAMVSLWVVNDPIAEHYRTRYPAHAHKVHVVRNGYDLESVNPDSRPPRGSGPLRFGYLGTVNIGVETMDLIVDAWREARRAEPLLQDATLEIRGHIGAGASREANAVMETVLAAREDGVAFGGAVPKGEVADVYAHWDALLLPLIGGRYVTSGKVYEYMATGLPIVSVHEQDHDASALLRDYPLWTGSHGFDRDRLVEALGAAARMATTSTPGLVERCRAHAATFERTALMRPAVERLALEAGRR